MRRRVLNLVTAGSLLLCVAAVGLWVRSYFTTDAVMGTWPSGRLIVETASGGIGLGLCLGGDWNAERGLSIEQKAPQSRLQPILDVYQVANPTTMWWGGGAGFVSASTPFRKGPWHFYSLIVPCWAVSCASALLPACRVLRRRFNRQREPHRFCGSCGYDLRATPERCPECGTPAATTPA